MTDAFGTITWWGFSPAVDLQDAEVELKFEKMKLKPVKESADLNILLIGAGDPRHVLKSISRKSRHREKNIHFYVLESNIELYARYLLLITLALEPQTRMGLQEKTEMFLELFGNTLIREQSMEYVHTMSKDFIKMVTDFDFLEKKMPIIDMSLLKYKERDMLEAIFKFWRNPDHTVFDVRKCWELRLRKYLGVRYDAIPNVFDWDYSMKLTEKGAEVINSRNYARWRETGVAYMIREGTYGTANKTLASGMLFNIEGERIARRGFWGDILVSPYITFGIECEEKKFFRKQNNTLIHSGEDVAEYNVLSLLHELAHKEKYVPPQPEQKEEVAEKQSATLTEITEEDELDEGEMADLSDEYKEAENNQNPLTVDYVPVTIDNVKISFLPLGSAHELKNKSRYQKLFNMVYLSNSMVHLLNNDLAETFADEANVLLETAKFMLELTKEQTAEYVKKITQIAEDVGCKSTTPCDELNDAFAFFKFKRNS